MLLRELGVAGAACLLLLALGLYPQDVLHLTRSAAGLWVANLSNVAAPAVVGVTGH